MNNSINRVTLVSVGEVKTAENGNLYVKARFKRGAFGKPVSRTFWASSDDEGGTTWKRATPKELKSFVGHDLSGQIFVEPVDIEPKDITIRSTGEVKTITSTVVVRFGDETLQHACRRYGVTLKEESESEEESSPALPAGLQVVATNGEAALS